MKNLEKYVVAVICVVCIVVFSNYYYQATALKHLDTVFLFESSLSILESGRPTSTSLTTWADAIKTFTVPVETLCASDLKRTETQAYNVLDNHAYTALYPISLLTALAGSELTFAILNALAHLLLLIVAFVFLRSQGASMLASLAFVLCVALYPAWSISAVGDYYLDRLYMPFALLSLCFVHAIITRSDRFGTDKRLLIGFIVSLIVAASCTERAAIMMMSEIAFFLLLFPQVRKTPLLRNAMLVLLVLLGSYLFLYFKFVFKGIDGGGGLFANALPVLLDPLQRLRNPLIKPFVLVNLLFLGFLVPFSGFRYLVLVILAMIPNLLITVGGAELSGWATHYHAMYLPFLIFAASVGYLRLAHYFKAGIGRFALPLLVSGYVFLAVGFLNPQSGKLEEHFLTSARQGILGQIYHYYTEPQYSSVRVAGEMARSLDALVPKGSKVSAIEGVMPALYKSRTLSYYPVDMDNADFLVISGTAANGQPISVSGAMSYHGPAKAEALNQCLSQRMISKGFALVKDFPAMGVLVFKRK